MNLGCTLSLGKMTMQTEKYTRLKNIDQNPSSSMCYIGNTFRIKGMLNLNFLHDTIFHLSPDKTSQIYINK